MKKRQNLHLDDVVVRKTHGHGIISGWIWPYVIMPACVAGLLGVIFFIVGPLLLHTIGVSHSLEFWLTALGLWALLTIVCTLIWIYSGRHLVKSNYYMIANNEVKQNQVNGRGKINSTYNEIDKYTQEQSNIDQPDSHLGAQQVIQRYYSRSEPSPPPDDFPVRIQMKEVDFEKNRKIQMEEDDDSKSYSKTQMEEESDVHHYSQTEMPVIQVNEPQTNSPADDQFLMPEPQNSHPPRRVSYAGVISIDSPPPEQSILTEEEKNHSKLYPPRPPTPRFPRGMRVGSNDSSISVHLADIYLSHKQQKKSISEIPEVPKLVHLDQEKDVCLEKDQVEQTKLEQEGICTIPSEKSELSHLSGSDNGSVNVDNPDLNLVNNRENRKSSTMETSVFKKVRLSDELDKTNGRNSYKRMSLDRNQFLGWNPEEGVLAEADPGSKEREQRRWTRSLGAWRTSTSTPWNCEISEDKDNSEEEEFDDVFQEEVEDVSNSRIDSRKISQTVIFTQAVVTVHSSK